MRRYRAYKFTDKHHSKGGIRSSIAGGISFLCTFLCIFFAYREKGEGGTYLVLFGVFAIIGCLYGLIAGNRSFREEESYYLFSRIGTGLNLVLTVFWIAITAMGILI